MKIGAEGGTPVETAFRQAKQRIARNFGAAGVDPNLMQIASIPTTWLWCFLAINSGCIVLTIIIIALAIITLIIASKCLYKKYSNNKSITV